MEHTMHAFDGTVSGTPGVADEASGAWARQLGPRIQPPFALTRRWLRFALLFHLGPRHVQ